GDDDTCRPLSILMHGGAFVVGTKEDGNMVSLAQEIAARGYVVASINYRLGWHTQVTENTIA
ncbi:MAG: carboxylesterase family protein, partial [Saprospiraceae bacterium]|nr:carboxylesterase family protein [Saprospiraceae bacterium]